jgi:hypothetical protein
VVRSSRLSLSLSVGSRKRHARGQLVEDDAEAEIRARVALAGMLRRV